jgi:hypothetical protein
MATIDDLKVNLEGREKDIEFRNINITNYLSILEELDNDPEIETDEDLKLHKQHIENLLKSERREMKKDELIYNALKKQYEAKLANGECLECKSDLSKHLETLVKENPDVVIPEIHLNIEYVQIVDTDGKKKWVTELDGELVKVRAE